jgi:hypothetical protein
LAVSNDIRNGWSLGKKGSWPGKCYRKLAPNGVLIVDPETKLWISREEVLGDHTDGVDLRAFHRSGHVLVLLFERASRCYELTALTLDAFSQCFEQRDALGS